LEALQLLGSSGNSSSQTSQNRPFLYSSARDSYLTIPVPSLDTTRYVKPRAFLQYLPLAKRLRIADTSIDTLADELMFKADLLDHHHEDFFFPIHMTRRSMSIGNDPNMDVCLRRLVHNPRFNCAQVSDKHACVHYDDLTDTYELLNYSANGTIVDSCLYGIDLDADKSLSNTCLDPFFSSSILGIAERTERLATMQPAESRYPLFGQNKQPCECRFIVRPSGPRQWEGPAQLKHGSHIQIGCLSFLFVVVNYEFVLDNESDKAPSPIRKIPRDNTNSKLARKQLKSDARVVDKKRESMLDELVRIKQELAGADLRGVPSESADTDSAKFNVNKKYLLF
jgi:pSer/pThr/pTyr-binding forkhead associated (FHA) protein